MKRIEKGQEPLALPEVRRTPGATTWNALRDKQSPREALCREQKGLCAYCMSRIRANEKDMKIEHWLSRNEAGITDEEKKRRCFDWNNLLGVCKGGELTESNTFCDTYRGSLGSSEQDLFTNPSAFPPDAGSLFSCNTAGLIRPSNTSPNEAEITRDIERLNLNAAVLKRNRRMVIVSLQKRLEKDASRRGISRLLNQYSDSNLKDTLPPFSQVAVWYLERKMRIKGWL